MVKRSLEETARNGVEGLILEESRASKKSKKEKKSHKVGNPAAALPVMQDGADEDKPSLSKEERREKRRLKKEKRALKESMATTGTADTDGNVEAATGAEADTTEDKAARKAEKARLKEIKRAKKNGTSEIKPESNGTSKPAKANGTANGTVNGTSNGLSSTHSTSAYTESSTLAALPQSTIDTFHSTNHITITDPLSATNILRPITSFAHLPSNPAIKGNPFAQYTTPTPIQAAAWPFLLSGRDVIGVAETGSGKTLAFALPCVTYITSLLASSKRKPTGPLAVIVSPTRELACQIDAHISSLASLAGLSSVCIYGGVPKPPQRDALRTASIVVATPGRLNDLLSEGVTSLSSARYVVLDEADRMLDTGFEDAIRLILSSCAPSTQRQTLMFTATWPPSIRALASTFLKSPIKIAIGADNPTGDLRANARITQTVEVVDPRQKETRLLQLLRKHQPKDSHDRILVFCLYKKEATRIELFLRSNRIRVAAIHGDLSQAQRTASLDAFKTGQVPVLVATDVAARGLDIPEVKAVINVTFPLTVEDYVHRIGRTGRAGKEGLAVTMFTEHDKAQSGALINVLKAAKQPVPDELLKFGTTVKKKGHEAYGAFYKDPGVGEVKEAKKIKFDD